MKRTPAKTLTPWLRTTNTSPAKDKLWQSMRIMRAGFTAPELATVSEVSVTNAEKYVRALRKAGFLRRTVSHTPGQAGSADRYQLIRNTGPLSPIKHKKGGMFDRNTGVRWGDDGKRVATEEDTGE